MREPTQASGDVEETNYPEEGIFNSDPTYGPHKTQSNILGVGPRSRTLAKEVVVLDRDGDRTSDSKQGIKHSRRLKTSYFNQEEVQQQCRDNEVECTTRVGRLIRIDLEACSSQVRQALTNMEISLSND
ncbi:hypothetical protein L1887_36474 [Cichorium endivia]|nr:hypothetical protein L1887_36474 [Cichorium endivia]